MDSDEKDAKLTSFKVSLIAYYVKKSNSPFYEGKCIHLRDREMVFTDN